MNDTLEQGGMECNFLQIDLPRPNEAQRCKGSPLVAAGPVRCTALWNGLYNLYITFICLTHPWRFNPRASPKGAEIGIVLQSMLKSDPNGFILAPIRTVYEFYLFLTEKFASETIRLNEAEEVHLRSQLAIGRGWPTVHVVFEDWRSHLIVKVKEGDAFSIADALQGKTSMRFVAVTNHGSAKVSRSRRVVRAFHPRVAITPCWA